MTTPDPFHLDRFVDAQEPLWDQVLEELRAGHKQSHWMWFVFPQLATLGRSTMARHFGLSGLDEARAYLAHPLLGARLRDACRLLLLPGRSDAAAIFGTTDALKLRSCLSLFDAAAPREPLFAECLGRYYAGKPDPLTLRQIAPGADDG
ncbi:DUF1810 domain-containing protein [Ramlibacter sp. AN1015]|uniref:DUF1810 domain-containing protein n=1 Tax=Ramlibacter sp. AN1015 TaxID=3133428 RepID=UPI0030BD489C